MRTRYEIERGTIGTVLRLAAGLACALALVGLPARAQPAAEGPPAAAPEPVEETGARPPSPEDPEGAASAAPAEEGAQGPGDASEPIRLVPIPEPDLSGLEEEVAAQLVETRAQLEDLLGRRGTTVQAQAEALGELGRLYHAYQLFEPAEAAYYDAHLLAPEDHRWAYYLAALYQERGEFEKAALLYGRALEHQQTVAAMIRLAESYIALERLDEAESVLRYALSGAPDLPSARALLGEIALSRQDYRLAIDYLEAALAAVPEATRLHYPIALAYRGLGDTEKAREHLALRGEVGVRPADPLLDELEELKRGGRIHVLRGRAAFRSGDFQTAVREFQAAVEADPESVTARVNLGSALGQAGDRIGAIHQLRRVIELDPDSATARFNLGILLGLEGDLPAAIQQLREAARLAPRDAGARHELARHLRRSGEGEAALAEYRRASDLAPFDPEVRLGEVQLLLDLGRLEQARDRLDATHGVLPREPTVVAAYARLLAAVPDPALRDGERAVELARPLVEAMPTTHHVEILAQALAESGRCEEAADWQRRAVEAHREAGDAQVLPRLEAELARYEAGAPCRYPGTPTKE